MALLRNIDKGIQPPILNTFFISMCRICKKLLNLQNMALNGIISQFSPNLFWDTRLESMDMESNAPYIVQRVLENGRMVDWKILVSYYTVPRIAEIAINLRSLEPRALSFISAVSSTPIEKFRCYTLRQSSQRHWIY